MGAGTAFTNRHQKKKSTSHKEKLNKTVRTDGRFSVECKVKCITPDVANFEEKQTWQGSMSPNDLGMGYLFRRYGFVSLHACRGLCVLADETRQGFYLLLPHSYF